MSLGEDRGGQRRGSEDPGPDLVAGEAQHNELVSRVLCSHLREILVVGRCRTSPRREVHDEDGWDLGKVAEVYLTSTS